MGYIIEPSDENRRPKHVDATQDPNVMAAGEEEPLPGETVAIVKATGVTDEGEV